MLNIFCYCFSQCQTCFKMLAKFNNSLYLLKKGFLNGPLFPYREIVL